MLFYELLNAAFSEGDFVMISDTSHNFEVSSVVCHSKAAQENSVFVAINGTNHNGSAYAFEAVQNGAKAIITDLRAEIPALLALRASVILVNQAAIAYALLVQQEHHKPDKQLSLFGITGTNGKTSTAWTIAKLLENCGVPSAFIGTLGSVCKDKWTATNNTTPDAGLLYSLFDNYAAQGVRAVAMEVSSHSLVQNRAYGMTFEVGVFTNLTRDHLDFHKTMENYGAAKAKLFDQCQCGIINIDDPFGKKLAKTIPCKAVTCSLNPGTANYTAKILEQTMNGTAFELTLPDGRTFETANVTPGLFNVQNALEALAACAEHGIDPEALCTVLPKIASVPGRFEKIPNQFGIHIIVDYAHTPDGVEKVLRCARELTSGKLISVFGCGGNRDVPKRFMMGRLSGEIADYTVITCDNPRTENEFDIACACVDGCEDIGGSYTVIMDREKAIQHAISVASDGDTVVVMGKGHETYQLMDGLKFPFDDKQAIQKALTLRQR